MRIMVNCSAVHTGGSLQVAASVCELLERYGEHWFVVVLSSELAYLQGRLQGYGNVETVVYDVPKGVLAVLSGRNRVLDGLVSERSVDVVLTVFGPSKWRPKVPHLCGFARAHMLFMDSVCFRRLPVLKRMKERLFYRVVRWDFARGADAFFTENEYISRLLEQSMPGHRVWTVTNYYNQVFDDRSRWVERRLEGSDDVRFLCVTANYPHKNLRIAIDVARILKELRPELKFRFVFTVSGKEFAVADDVKEHFELIGRVGIEECPSLYEQADVMFQPSLLECFSATYPEAMRMGVPIVTTDLEFARGLCGDAALYYSPESAEEAAHAIVRLLDDGDLRQSLITAGKDQLKRFDTSDVRAEKLVRLCEDLKKV